ncbi:class E sortase [Jiangella aurantiaca]|uniref:Class E sortase n=1 Tax=Jiangella aurantiaca TaxID=2530373 RepID=A0A4V2YRX3_9ACTN|nr:class E sortase [Jiangella aurantiaca]TDD67197.1 class E sortase [Jiangella aurantiaca]
MQRRAAPRHRRASGSRSSGRRTALVAAGVAGELLLTAGALVLLFVVYTFWGTGLQTAAAQDDLRDEFQQHLLSREEPTGAEADGGDDASAEPAPLELGDAYGILRIPRFGDGWERIVIEGTDPDDLRDGPGHYVDSVDPGQLGNFAVAAHRSGHGEPFARFAELREGDIVEIETIDGVFRYELDDAPDGDNDGNVIEATELWVVDPVPGEPAGTEPAEARLTLTTCWPRWGSEKRMYATGVLVDERPRDTATG